MDYITTPLLVLVLGNLAQELIRDVCKDYLKDKLKSVFGWLDKLGEQDKVELAYQDAMERAGHKHPDTHHRYLDRDLENVRRLSDGVARLLRAEGDDGEVPP